MEVGNLQRSDRVHLLFAGVTGFAGTLFYLAAAFLDLPVQPTFLVAMLWPVLSIGFVLALFRTIELERPGIILQLAFVLCVIAFATLASMLAIQLAVEQGIQEYRNQYPAISKETWDATRRSLRMVDLGMDVAWDMFIGSGMTLFGYTMLRHSRFGWTWGSVAMILGVALVALNVSTFPWPPNTRGLFDIGPIFALYLLALSAWMIIQSRRNAPIKKGHD